MPNDLSAVTPKLLAQGLLALRETCVMPRLVNSDYGDTAASRGAVIDVPVPSAITSTPVNPANTAPDPTGLTPSSVPIAMDQWREAPFTLTDKDLMNVFDGVIPMQASEAIKALANYVDAYLLGLYTGIPYLVGTPGTAPFGASVAEATAARKVLNNNLAPLQDRRMVIDSDAEANALGLRAFQDASFSGDASAINEGQINRKLGFDWFLDQNVPTHVAGTAGGTEASPTTIASATVEPAGETSLAVTVGADNDLNLKQGDIITIAGDANSYAVAQDVSIPAGDTGMVQIAGGLKQATAGDEAITVKGDHVVNLAFHRDAIAFANRPLADNTEGLGNLVQTATDAVSGLSLRLEISREYKRTRYSFDILFGAALVRPELACRVAG
ncbi:hypothetical protein DPQ33_01630 [Oceanidesulfovibrio indonesiensis]|uniref:P22 coat-protein 5 family protein n=1 Tax=Oceanidesulfovibrio indonesiensis TaxID=54767 RepID=A0A7M3MKN1_9BACT|nr:P22 phage major capsid protein family protein [Oceanidesulfovibrio indonesiensis]TVM19952.1 hypothetical protein DPQ33_01630 [Oceanidesulfovibrio indonesiensis]